MSIKFICAALISSLIVNWVIDPGHGGADGGAVSGTVIESEINLEIALKLNAVMGLLGVPAVLTRDSETLTYPDNATTIRKMKNSDMKARAKLIHDTPNAVLISIHQNKFPSNNSVHGAQVFYAKSDGSRQLAERVQQSLNALAGSARESKLIPDSIFLLKNTDCPAILVECGFISNAKERDSLCDGEYQTKIALAIFAALQSG
jgi:N-acetylmuramoyl-L-alanine amidase